MRWPGSFGRRYNTGRRRARAPYPGAGWSFALTAGGRKGRDAGGVGPEGCAPRVGGVGWRITHLRLSK